MAVAVIIVVNSSSPTASTYRPHLSIIAMMRSSREAVRRFPTVAPSRRRHAPDADCHNFIPSARRPVARCGRPGRAAGDDVTAAEAGRCLLGGIATQRIRDLTAVRQPSCVIE